MYSAWTHWVIDPLSPVDPVSHADVYSREPFAQSSRDKTWVTEGVQASVKVAPTYLELIALICAYSVLIFDAIKISTE